MTFCGSEQRSVMNSEGYISNYIAGIRMLLVIVAFECFRLFLYITPTCMIYDLLDLCNVLFLVNVDLIMLFISLILSIRPLHHRSL
jgi:hypothetical protein